MTKSKGYRRNTRKILRKKPGEHGISALGPLLQNYKIGDEVAILIDPSTIKGMPHSRYQGSIGKISEIRKRAYVIEIKAGKTVKKIIARPEHIKLHVNQREELA